MSLESRSYEIKIPVMAFLPLVVGVIGFLLLSRWIDEEEAKFLFRDSLAWLAGKEEGR